MEQTYQELLNELDNTPCQNSEFIEINKMGMLQVGPMDDQDYQYFWGCMKIYDAYGVNFFPQYLRLYLGFYGDYSKGIANWIHEDVQNGYRHLYSLKELVETLRFFALPVIKELASKILKMRWRRPLLFTNRSKMNCNKVETKSAEKL